MKFKDYPTLNYLGKLKTRRSTEIASSPLGVGFECLDRDMWDPNQAWPVLDELGVKWARVQTGWAKTEKQPGKYDFAWLDDIVNKLLERGVQPWLSISYGNPLYCGTVDSVSPERGVERVECPWHGVGFPPIHSNEERTAWTNYVRVLATHFKTRVSHFEVWNEPDLESFWKCGPKAARYVDLARITSGAIRAGHPDAAVIGGAIAWGMTAWSLKWLEDCLEAGLGVCCDILSYHGYKSVPERHSAQEIAAFRHLLNRYKPSMPYWQGEAGIQSRVPAGGNSGALSKMVLSEEIQARMLLRRTLLELHNGCTMSSYFHMADFSHYAGHQQTTFHYGLVRLEDGSPKPSFYALQSLCTLLGEGTEPAEGRTACHLSVTADTADSRATKVASWHANFVRGEIPIHSWWIPDSLEADPVVQRAEMTFWINRDLRLDDPILIDPMTQEVFAVRMERDRRTCGESWMSPDPEAEGIRVFYDLPVSTDPLILTDRSLIELR